MDLDTSLPDFEKAAGLVARGTELETAAKRLNIPFDELKEYTKEYSEEWNRTIKSERGSMLGQAGAEALMVLRKLIREGEEKSQVAAATILMKFWMTTLRHDKSDKGGNAFEILQGRTYPHIELAMRMDAEEELERRQAEKRAIENELANEMKKNADDDDEKPPETDGPYTPTPAPPMSPTPVVGELPCETKSHPISSGSREPDRIDPPARFPEERHDVYNELGSVSPDRSGVVGVAHLGGTDRLSDIQRITTVEISPTHSPELVGTAANHISCKQLPAASNCQRENVFNFSNQPQRSLGFRSGEGGDRMGGYLPQHDRRAEGARRSDRQWPGRIRVVSHDREPEAVQRPREH